MDYDLPFEKRTAIAPDETLMATFTLRAERAASVVHRCAGVEEAARLVLSLAGTGPVSMSPTFVERYPRMAGTLAERVDAFQPQEASEAARAVIGVSAGEAVVAETGSVLVSEHGLGDRLVSMLSPVLVQVVAAAAVLASLDEVGAILAERHAGGVSGYHALVTGPSRSADIERSLTVGVQGPAELHVIILDSAQGAESPSIRRETHPVIPAKEGIQDSPGTHVPREFLRSN